MMDGMSIVPTCFRDHDWLAVTAPVANNTFTSDVRAVGDWRRYRKPIMVSETSWHDGHPVHHRRYPGFNKDT
ncbi:MAG: hypothetical protein EON58_09750 [Alphaproteobacteria bacterium]|nr:MAG: hypothetical protein EON58_09750 [Alphaproteobacteria bacterium]